MRVHKPAFTQKCGCRRFHPFYSKPFEALFAYLLSKKAQCFNKIYNEMQMRFWHKDCVILLHNNLHFNSACYMKSYTNRASIHSEIIQTILCFQIRTETLTSLIVLMTPVSLYRKAQGGEANGSVRMRPRKPCLCSTFHGQAYVLLLSLPWMLVISECELLFIDRFFVIYICPCLVVNGVFFAPVTWTFFGCKVGLRESTRTVFSNTPGRNFVIKGGQLDINPI